MNASQILNDNMTLDEQLAAIDAAIKAKQEQFNKENDRPGVVLAPLDPADLTMCEGCQ